MSQNNNKKQADLLNRREVLKGLATVPVLGLFFIKLWQKLRLDRLKKSNLLQDLVKENKAPSIVKNIGNNDHLRVGVVGYGGRGGHLTRGLGFATPDWTTNAAEGAKKNKLNKGFETFMSQTDLNCSLVGVCDLFDARAESGVAASKNEIRAGGKPKESAVRYRHYTDLVSSKDIDAVIIATPDHWHSRVAIAAAKEGKHVYCEKGLTRTFDETIELYDTVKETGITFQLGHQNRQVEAYEQAKKIINQGLLGPVNLVQLTTNRNSPGGAWVWGLSLIHI